MGGTKSVQQHGFVCFVITCAILKTTIVGLMIHEILLCVITLIMWRILCKLSLELIIIAIIIITDIKAHFS